MVVEHVTRASTISWTRNQKTGKNWGWSVTLTAPMNHPWKATWGSKSSAENQLLRTWGCEHFTFKPSAMDLITTFSYMYTCTLIIAVSFMASHFLMECLKLCLVSLSSYIIALELSLYLVWCLWINFIHCVLNSVINPGGGGARL